MIRSRGDTTLAASRRMCTASPDMVPAHLKMADAADNLAHGELHTHSAPVGHAYSSTPPGGSAIPQGGSAIPPGGSAIPPGGSATPPGGSVTPQGGSATPPGGSATLPVNMGATVANQLAKLRPVSGVVLRRRSIHGNSSSSISEFSWSKAAWKLNGLSEMRNDREDAVHRSAGNGVSRGNNSKTSANAVDTGAIGGDVGDAYEIALEEARDKLGNFQGLY